MRVETAELTDVLLFRPAPHRDERGFFTRTFDAEVAAAHGLCPEAYVQDSQSRSVHGTVRGLHGRGGAGEAKLVRCARGAILDVLVDSRPSSPTYGRHQAFRLDDEQFRMLYVPRGFLHGFQVLSEVADICYRIDRPHDPTEDLSVRYDDPDLGIAWPLPVDTLSPRDELAGSWRDLSSRSCHRLRITVAGAAGPPMARWCSTSATNRPRTTSRLPRTRGPTRVTLSPCGGAPTAAWHSCATTRRFPKRHARSSPAPPSGRPTRPWTSWWTPACSHRGSSSSSRARTAAPGARPCWPGTFVPAPGPQAGVVVDVYGLMHDRDQAGALLARREALSDDGTLVLQFPSYAATLRRREWNALRHGHFAYHSVPAARRLLAQAGLSVLAARSYDLYSGSVLLLASRSGAGPSDEAAAVDELELEELAAGVRDPQAMAHLATALVDDVAWLRTWVESQHDGAWLYGAGSRAVAVLAAAGLRPGAVAAIADGAPAKQGRRMPGTDIPIVAPEALLASGPRAGPADAAGPARRAARRLASAVASLVGVRRPLTGRPYATQPAAPYVRGPRARGAARRASPPTRGCTPAGRRSPLEGSRGGSGCSPVGSRPASPERGSGCGCRAGTSPA